MPYSMTGFGVGSVEEPGFSVKAVVRSINSRFLDVIIRSKDFSMTLEEKVRNTVKSGISRGRIDIEVIISEDKATTPTVVVHKGLLSGYVKALEEVRKELASEGAVELGNVLQFADSFLSVESGVTGDTLEEAILTAVEQATQNMKATRLQEGETLTRNVLDKVQALEACVRSLHKRTAEVVQVHHQRLRQRIAQLLDGVELDEQRLEQEVAVLADRSCVDEELVRLASHLEQARQTLASNEPIGRRLDFIVQEMNREANTIGSKSTDSIIATTVIEIKSLLEKIREQANNFE